MSVLFAAMLLSAAPASLDFEDCRIGQPGAGPRLAARCTTLTVPENRNEPDGRQIELKVAHLRARSGDSELPPLVFIAGGPGQSATESFPAVARAFEDIRRYRDILVLDQRGTGGSNPLACPQLEESAAIPVDFDPQFAREAAASCVATLDADVRYYTTLDAVADLETMRKAFGHEQFVLYGISYGTRVAQEYLRRHADHVNAVILDGVTVPGEALGPQIASDAQRALDIMFERCADTPECNETFPQLADRFAALRERLEARPLTVELRDPYTGERTQTEISWPRAASLFRMYSYAPESLALLPLLLTQAEAGDWQAFAGNLLALERESETLLYTGMHNSVVCSEDAPAMTATTTPEEPAYLGTLTVDFIQAICTAWPSRRMPEDFYTPVVSDIPVLLLSGEADPVTPPENAETVLEHLSNARHLVAPGQGHGVAWRGCASKLMAAFVTDRDPQALEADCLQKLSASPFFIDRNGPTP